jgi:hypothetical protein
MNGLCVSPHNHIGSVTQYSVSPKGKWNHRACGIFPYPDNAPHLGFLATGPCLVLPRMQQEGKVNIQTELSFLKRTNFIFVFPLALLVSETFRTGRTDSVGQNGGQIVGSSDGLNESIHFLPVFLKRFR